MSRAFVKDTDSVDDLPDRLISEHPNYVTPNGLRLIGETVDQLQTALAEAQVNSDRDAISTISRELRYWDSRKATAILVDKPKEAEQVRFGSVVTILRREGKKVYQIVGEDEAHPSHGTLSHASPLAQALLGKEVGDVIETGVGAVKIVEIYTG